MEEEGKRIKRETISNKYLIGMLENLRAEAEEKLEAIERALNAEYEKSRKLEDARDHESWAKAFEAGKRPNYEIDEIEQERLLKEADAKQALL